MLAYLGSVSPRNSNFQERSLKTGRHVPIEVLQDSINRVPLSVEKLRPHVDLVVEICNAENSGIRITRIGTKLENGDFVMITFPDEQNLTDGSDAVGRVLRSHRVAC